MSEFAFKQMNVDSLVTQAEEASTKKGGYLKILNKKKDTVLIFYPAFGKKEVKWDEFNELYQIDKNDPHKAYLKPECKEKFDKIDSMLSDMCTMMLMSNAKDPGIALGATSILGSKLKEVCEISGFSKADAVKMFRKYYNNFINGSLAAGIGFGKPHHKMMSKRQIAKSNQNIRKINRENKEVVKENKSEDTQHLEYDYGCSIGDMLKAKGQKL